MKSFNLSILLILFAVNNTKAINYASYRLNDTVSIDVTRDTPRTTREILENLNKVQITSPESLQDGTEHLLQFAALLRTRILDTFGILIYDYYDDFDSTEMHSLYRIYQDTLERKYNIFDIVPNVLINKDLKPLSICNYIYYHVQTCLRQMSHVCANIKFPEIEQEQCNDTTSIDSAKSIYDSANLEDKYEHGISLPSILDFLKTNRLQFTIELFSGLLHNVHYDDYDDGVKTAERVLIHYFLSNPRRSARRNLLRAQAIKQYSSVTKLLKGFLRSYQFPSDIKLHAEYLAEHISREPNAIDENIELLGAAYEDGDINLRYLFELVFPDDAHDADIIDARSYLLDQILKQDILENYLRVEKYQQALPNQMLMGILGQLRDIDFITDIVTSLHLHAKYWHSSHMIENLNQLMELFDAYENLRGIPEHRKLMITIDGLRRRLTNSNNATIEMSCTNPRNCLRIGLNIILQCNGINRQTKRLINRFLYKSNLQCLNQKWMDKPPKSPENHETASKKPIITTTRKNLDHQHKFKKLSIANLTTEAPTLPTKAHTNPNCNDDEPCEEDDVLATGSLHDGNVTAEINSTAQAIEREGPETIITSTISSIEVSTESLPIEDLVHETSLNPIENTTAVCNGSSCQKNESDNQEESIVTTSLSDLDKKVTDQSTQRSSHSNAGTTSSLLTSTTRIPSTKASSNLELFTTTQETIVTTSKPTCQHRDLHYRQKLRRLEKIDKSISKTVHRGSVENLKVSGGYKDTVSLSAINAAAGSSVSGNEHAQVKEHSKTELKSGNNSNASHGHLLGKIIETVGDHLKTKLQSDHGATVSVESESTHSSGTTHSNKLTDGKANLDSKKKLQADDDALASPAVESSQEHLLALSLASRRSGGKTESKDKSKKKHHAHADDLAGDEKSRKHGSHRSSMHTDIDHIKNLIESKDTLALKKKLLANHNDLLSIENDSAHAKQKSRNKELSVLSKLKNLNGGLHTRVLEAAESQSELSGRHETSDRSLGGKSQHTRRNHGKTEEASTTEHRRKITQQYRESSRRNLKKSRRRNSHKGKTVKLGTSEEPATEFLSGEKHRYVALSKGDLFSPSDEIVLPLNSSETDVKGRLFDWNTPLLSNYDIAMNDKIPDKVYYRSKRGLAKNENKNTNANVNKFDVESRLFDINLPFFSNYDVALNDKLPGVRRSSRAQRDTVKQEQKSKNDTSVKKKDLNSTGQNVSERIFDFNVPMGSNQKWRMNAPETPPEATPRKQHYRSRRDTIKKNETHMNETKPLNNDTNIPKPTSNNNASDLEGRFLSIPKVISVNVPGFIPDIQKTNTTSKNTTDNTKDRLDFYLPTVGHENPKVKREIHQFDDDDDDDDFRIAAGNSLMKLYEPGLGRKSKPRKGRETKHVDDDPSAPADNPGNSHSERRSVDTLYSRLKVEVPNDDDDDDNNAVDQRLFDFNLPMGSNQKWRFNAPTDEEKKNFRGRRSADAITASTNTTATNSSLINDRNLANNHNNITNTITFTTIAAIELRMGNDNGTITDSNTTEKINATAGAKQ